VIAGGVVRIVEVGVGQILLHECEIFLHAGIVGPLRVERIFLVAGRDQADGVVQSRGLEERDR
jgi:hypothetical protein